MSAPWKKNQTTLEKVEERVGDWLDQLKLDERVGDLKEQIKDLKLDERAVDLKDQISASDRLNDLKAQIAASEQADLVREKVPGVKPAKKSHKRRNVALLALGAGAAACAYAKSKAAKPVVKTPPFSAPQPPPRAAGATTPAGATPEDILAAPVTKKP